MSIPNDADKNIRDNLDQAKQRDAEEGNDGKHASPEQRSQPQSNDD